VISVYPSGDEACSGPVKRLVIPTESVRHGCHGVGYGWRAAALLTPYNGNAILLDTNQAESSLTMGFNTGAYTILNGKRILRFSLLYSSFRVFGTDERDNGPYFYLTDSIAPFSGIIYSSGDDVS
jgi:hypothetical protein